MRSLELAEEECSHNYSVETRWMKKEYPAPGYTLIRQLPLLH
jgi:hypothetical protein